MRFKICCHNIKCHIRGYADDLDSLEESWEEQIKEFLCKGYCEGEFAILDEKGNEEFLCWRIVRE